MNERIDQWEKNGLQAVDTYTFDIALELFMSVTFDAFREAPSKVGYNPGLSLL